MTENIKVSATTKEHPIEPNLEMIVQESSGPVINFFDEDEIPYNEVENIHAVDSPSQILMLPWYENGPCNIQERLNFIDASRWVKSNMLKLCRQLGVKADDQENDLRNLLMRIERSRLARPKPQNKSPSPHKRNQREIEGLKNFGVNYGDEPESRDRGRKAITNRR